MPDISMCQDYECPSRSACYRFTAVPAPDRQCYSDYDRQEGMDMCDSFWGVADVGMSAGNFSGKMELGMLRAGNAMPKLLAMAHLIRPNIEVFQVVIRRMWLSWNAHKLMAIPWNGHTCERIVLQMLPGGSVYLKERGLEGRSMFDIDLFLAMVYLFKTFTRGEWLVALSEVD